MRKKLLLILQILVIGLIVGLLLAYLALATDESRTSIMKMIILWT